MKLSARATVTLTIEIDQSAWGADCGMEQVFKQAREGAISKLYAAHGNRQDIRVTGVKVTAILVPEPE